MDPTPDAGKREDADATPEALSTKDSDAADAATPLPPSKGTFDNVFAKLDALEPSPPSLARSSSASKKKSSGGRKKRELRRQVKDSRGREEELRRQLEEAAAEAKDQSDQAELDKSALRSRLGALQAQVNVLSYGKDLAEEEVNKLKREASESQTSSSEAERKGELQASRDAFAEYKIAADKKEQEADEDKAALRAKLKALKLELEDAKNDADNRAQARLQASEDEVKRLFGREAALVAEMQSLRDYTNENMTANLEEQRRVNALIDDLRQEVADEKYKTGLAQEEAKRLLSSSQTTSSESQDQERLLRQQIDRLRGELEESQYSEFVANEKMKKMKESSESQTSSSEAELQLQANREAFEDYKTAADKKDEQNEMDKSALRDKLAALKAEMATLTYDKHLAEEEVKKMKESSSESHTSSSEAELMSQVEALERKAREKAAQRLEEIKASDEKAADLLKKLGIAEDEAKEKAASRPEEIMASDEKAADVLKKLGVAEDEAKDKASLRLEEIMASDEKAAELLEQLGLARDQASVAFNAKTLAEDELKALKDSSGSSSSGSAGAPDSLLQRRIDQLLAEKKLTQQMAASMKKRLELDKRNLHHRLETVQEEADIAKYEKNVAEEELAKERENSASQTSTDAKLQEEVHALRSQLKELKESSGSLSGSSDADLTRQVERLEKELEGVRGELEESQYSEHLAKEAMQKMKDSSESQTSSSEAELQATRVAFEEHKLAADKKGRQSEFDKAALRRRLAELVDEGDRKDEKNEFDKSTLRDEVAALKSKLRMLSDDKHLGREKQSLSGSHTSSSEAELMSQVEALERKLREKEAQHREDMKASDDAKAQKAAERLEEIKVSDDKIAALLEQLGIGKGEASELAVQRLEEIKVSDDKMAALFEQLGIAKEEARLARTSKGLAVEELRSLKQSSDTGSLSTSDTLLERRVDQLRGEKKLKQREVDALRAEKKIADDDAIRKQQEFKSKLDALEGEVQAARMAKQFAEGELKRAQDASGSQSVSTEAELKLTEQIERLQEVIDEVTKGKEAAEAEAAAQKYRTDVAEEELKKLRDSSSSERSGSEAMQSLQQEVDKLKAEKSVASDEKASVDRRLKWEKDSKNALREKYESLEERVNHLQYEKHLAEEALQKMQGSDRGSMSSEAESRITAALQRRVDDLEEEKMATLEHVRSMEQKIASGQSDVSDETTFFRNSQIQSLTKEIEALDASVQSLTARNEELQESSEEARRDQSTRHRHMQEELAMEAGEEMPTSVEGKIEFLTKQSATLKDNLRQALKDADDARMAEKNEKDEVIDLQSRMDKTLLQLQSLKSSTRASMERIKEDHEKALMAAKLGPSAKLQQENDSLQTKLSESNRNLIKNQEDMIDIMSQYEAIRVAKEETDHLLSQSEAKNKELEHNIQAMKTKHDISLAQTRKEATAAEEKLKKRIAITEQAHTERISLQEKQIKELTERTSLQEKQIKELTKERDEDTKERNKLLKKIEKLSKERDQHRQSSDSLDDGTKEHMLRLQQEVDTSSEELLQSKDYIRGLEAEISTLREQLSDLVRDNKSKRRRDREIAALKVSINDRDETLQSLQEENASLRGNASRGGQEDTADHARYHNDPDPLLVDLQQENARLKLEALRASQRAGGSETVSTPVAASNDDVATELRLERDLRTQSEEIAAAIARRAKAGFDQRNKDLAEIRAELSFYKAALVELRSELTTYKTEIAARGGTGSNGGNASRALAAGQDGASEEVSHLRQVVSNLEHLCEMKERSLEDVKSELNEARREVLKYRSMAATLSLDVTKMGSPRG